MATTSNKRKYSVIYGVLIVFLGTFFYGYEYILRILPRVLRLELIRDYQLSASEFGLLASLYYYTYTLMQLPVGLLFDRYGTKKIFILASVTCAIGIGIPLLTPSYLGLCFSRLLLGFGSSFAFVGVLNLASLYLPQCYFSLVSGITTTIGMLFASVGGVYLSQILDSHSLNSVHFGLFVMGIFVSVLMIFFLPNDGSSLEEDSSVDLLTQSLCDLLSNKSIMLAGFLGGVLYMPTQVLLEVFGESYLAAHFPNLGRCVCSEILNWAYLGWIIGGPIMGVIIADRPHFKLHLLLTGVITTSALLIFLFLAPSYILTLWLIRILLVLIGWASSPQVLIFTIAQQAVPLKFSASAVALANAYVSLFGATVPHTIGILHDYLQRYFSDDQSLRLALLLLPLLCLGLGGGMCYGLISKIKNPSDQDESSQSR